MSEPITLTVLRDIPELGLQAGDTIVAEPGGQEPLGFWRTLAPDFSRVLTGLILGSLEPLCSVPEQEIVARLTPHAERRPPRPQPAPVEIDVDAALAALKQRPLDMPVEPTASRILRGDALGRHFQRWCARQRVRRCPSCHQDFEVRDRRAKRCEPCRRATKVVNRRQEKPHGQA